MKNPQKGFIFPILIAIVAVLVIGGGIYVYTKSKSQQPIANNQTTASTTDQISGWKTLNNKYGWSIKYPSNWEAGALGGDPESFEAPTIQGPIGCYASGLHCGTITIEVDTQGSNALLNTGAASKLTPEQFVLKYDLGASTNRDLISQEDTTVSGVPANEITYRQNGVSGYPNGQIFKLIVVKYAGEIYSIGYNEDFQNDVSLKSVDDWQLTPLFNQILSTFKFTQTTSTISGSTQSQSSLSSNLIANQIAGWQTYTNSQYGFEIKYPSDFKVSISSCFGYKNSGEKMSISDAVKIENKTSGIYVLICNFPTNYNQIAKQNSSKPTVINNLNAYVDKFVISGGGRAYYYIDNGDSSLFIDSFWPYPNNSIINDNDLKQGETLVNSIISTLKLINQQHENGYSNSSFDIVSPTQENFTANPIYGSVPLTVRFTNTIQSAGDESIDYGDGTSCSTANPDGSQNCNLYTHTYLTAGTYTAILYRHLPTTELARLTITVTDANTKQ